MTDTIETPKVYQALMNVLKKLNVAKTGTLPGNMGGKSYLTAEAVANEVKKLFVEENLILLPNEMVTHNESPDFGDKKVRFQVTIEGEYTIVHVEDGSKVQIGGIGQGLATGTAVAANIASTFALKNALQRTFLISEESVDAEGHKEQAVPKQAEAQRRLQEPAPRPNVAPRTDQAGVEALTELKAFMDKHGIDSTEMAKRNQILADKLGKEKAEVYPQLLAEMKEEFGA